MMNEVTVSPIDNIVTGVNIPEYKNTWMMTEILNGSNEEKKRGEWEDEIKLSKKNDKDTLIRIGNVYFADGIRQYHYDEAYRENMIPIYSEIKDVTSNEYLMKVNYDGNKISGFKRFSVEETDRNNRLPAYYTYEIDRLVFDWHWWGLLIASFPLKENYTARFLAHTSTGYSYSPFRWISFTVTGKEKINAGKWGKINCWVIKINAEVPWTIWVSTDQNIAPVLQLEVKMPEAVQRWKSI